MLREKRDKIIHNQGLIAQVAWEPVGGASGTDNGYTGMMNSQTNNVIMRVSEAAVITEASNGLTPAAAFKFMVDGTESQNLLLQSDMMASGSWNFFKGPLKNRLTPFDPVEHETQFKTVHRKMLEANAMPYGTAIGHIADKMEDGTPVPKDQVKIPFELRFRLPAEDMERFEFTDNEEAWYDRLQDDLVEGDIIYQVYGLTAPETLGGTEVHIANVRLLTDLVPSQAGDEHLYFRHRPQHKDLQYFPERSWKKYLRETQRFARNEDTIWNQEVPEGVWPEDNDEAEQFYIEQ